MARFVSTQYDRWGYVIVGVAIMLTFGMIYAWSVFVLPLEQEFGWRRDQTSLTFSITMTFFAIGIVAGGVLTDRKGPRFVSAMAAALIGVGLMAASLTESVMDLYLSYGVTCGLAVGLGYSCVISTVVRWFPDRAGAISGILMMGFGVGGLLLGFGATRLIENMGWRTAFQMLGVMIVLVIFVFGRLLRPNALATSGETAIDSGKTFMPATNRREDKNWRAVLGDAVFWMFWFWQVSVIAGGLSIVGHVVPLVIEKGFESADAAYALGAFSIFNGLGRVGLGFLSDKLGRKHTMIADSMLMILAMALFAGGFLQDQYLGVLIPAMIGGLAYGGAMPQVSAAIAAVFGARRLGVNFGLVSTGIIVAAFCGPYMSGLAKTVTGSYCYGFVFLAGLSSVGLLVAWRVGRLSP